MFFREGERDGREWQRERESQGGVLCPVAQDRALCSSILQLWDHELKSGVGCLTKWATQMHQQLIFFLTLWCILSNDSSWNYNFWASVLRFSVNLGSNPSFNIVFLNLLSLLFHLLNGIYNTRIILLNGNIYVSSWICSTTLEYKIHERCLFFFLNQIQQRDMPFIKMVYNSMRGFSVMPVARCLNLGLYVFFWHRGWSIFLIYLMGVIQK